MHDMLGTNINWAATEYSDVQVEGSYGCWVNGYEMYTINGHNT